MGGKRGIRNVEEITDEASRLQTESIVMQILRFPPITTHAAQDDEKACLRMTVGES